MLTAQTVFQCDRCKTKAAGELDTLREFKAAMRLETRGVLGLGKLGFINENHFQFCTQCYEALVAFLKTHE